MMSRLVARAQVCTERTHEEAFPVGVSSEGRVDPAAEVDPVAHDREMEEVREALRTV